jgi:ABC-type transporter Mla maintaining outer membrane lipid asymmetry permease subunit MlaE
MTERPDSIALAEQEVAEARAAALAELEVARARVRRRASSPLVVGGVLLGAVALGWLVVAGARRRRRVDAEGPDPWMVAARTVQVMVPLLMALVSAGRAAHARRARIGGDARREP